jgi:hypothetical protein
MNASGRVGHHYRSCVDGRPWPFKLSPIHHELLSSYLVRSAHAHGLSPHRFASFYLPCANVWNRDIDLNANTSLINEVAFGASLDTELVWGMTLSDLVPGHPVDGAIRNSGTSWCTCLGTQARSHTRYGLQYCPDCLDSCPAFLRSWRLSFVFACVKHKRFLDDRCGRCQAPVLLHRSRFAGTLCHKCGALLGGAPPSQPDLSINTALGVQERLLALQAQQEICLAGEMIKRDEFFKGLMILLKMVREKMHSHPQDFGQDSAIVLNSHDSLRSSPVAVRLVLCANVLELVDTWPHQFLRTAASLGMSQAGFSHLGRPPQWLATVLLRLPEKVRPRYAYRRSTLLNHVRQIEAAGGSQCRACRASALMFAARRWA